MPKQPESVVKFRPFTPQERKEYQARIAELASDKNRNRTEQKPVHYGRERSGYPATAKRTGKP